MEGGRGARGAGAGDGDNKANVWTLILASQGVCWPEASCDVADCHPASGAFRSIGKHFIISACYVFILFYFILFYILFHCLLVLCCLNDQLDSDARVVARSLE